MRAALIIHVCEQLKKFEENNHKISRNQILCTRTSVSGNTHCHLYSVIKEPQKLRNAIKN
uniref:Uncharacterized protein n=1 Tax=Rhizophora mucronata TaxID=61149 RepID=A0A2P2QMD6_RHIMU